MTKNLAISMVGGEEGGSNLKFMAYLTDPLVKSIIKVGYIIFYKILTSKLRHKGTICWLGKGLSWSWST